MMVEQKIEKIAQYADRVMLMSDGEVVDFDVPQKIFLRDDLLNYGVQAPVFTRVCKSLNIKNKNTGLYPVTLDEAYELMVRHEQNRS